MADEHKKTKKQDAAAATAAARAAAARATGRTSAIAEAILEQTAGRSSRQSGTNSQSGSSSQPAPNNQSDISRPSSADNQSDTSRPSSADNQSGASRSSTPTNDPVDATNSSQRKESHPSEPHSTERPRTEREFIDAIVDKIDDTDDILVTLSRDPSIDEMAAAIGLTLFLDRLGKHATAIYSGRTPKILEFLHPGATFEKNTDSLRDFIIALSKEKADHLRYKLEGDYVKIYVTPYKTTITPEDLDFTYGDYNVDLVLALDVPAENKLDDALKEFGKITENAEIIDVTTNDPGQVGQLEWSDPKACSVSELIAKLVFALEDDEITMNADEATAFLTGIVAETDRFSNAKTNADVMSLAADLMDRGADQQLIPRELSDDTPGGSPSAANQETPDGTNQENPDAAQKNSDDTTQVPKPESERKGVDAEGGLAINPRRRRAASATAAAAAAAAATAAAVAATNHLHSTPDEATITKETKAEEATATAEKAEANEVTTTTEEVKADGAAEADAATAAIKSAQTDNAVEAHETSDASQAETNNPEAEVTSSAETTSQTETASPVEAEAEAEAASSVETEAETASPTETEPIPIITVDHNAEPEVATPRTPIDLTTQIVNAPAPQTAATQDVVPQATQSAAPQTATPATVPTPEPTASPAPETVVAQTDAVQNPNQPLTPSAPEATQPPNPNQPTAPATAQIPAPAISQSPAPVITQPANVTQPATPNLMGAVDLPTSELDENAHLGGSVVIEPTETAKPKDYGAMMAAALAEPVPGLPTAQGYAAPAAQNYAPQAPTQDYSPQITVQNYTPPVTPQGYPEQTTAQGYAPQATTPPPVATAPNPAAMAAPTVSEQPELNGVPVINYGEPVTQPDPINLPPPPAPPIDMNASLPTVANPAMPPVEINTSAPAIAQASAAQPATQIVAVQPSAQPATQQTAQLAQQVAPQSTPEANNDPSAFHIPGM